MLAQSVRSQSVLALEYHLWLIPLLMAPLDLLVFQVFADQIGFDLDSLNGSHQRINE